MTRGNVEHRNALTLVEVLVVISIIGILVAMLIPALQAVREGARRTECQNNMRQVAIALHGFHTAQNSLPSHYNGKTLPQPLNEWDQYHAHSWRALLLPYVEEAAMRESIDWNAFATDPSNESIATRVVSTYVCPTGESPQSNTGTFVRHDRQSEYRAARSDYDGLAGIWDIFEEPPIGTRDGTTKYLRWGAWGTATFDDGTVTGDVLRYDTGKFNEVSDGLSNTILVVERTGRPHHFVNGRLAVTDDNPDAAYHGQIGWSASSPFIWRINFRDAGVNEDNSYGGLYSFHAGGASMARTDASVTFLSESTDVDTLKRLIGRSDNDP